MKFEEIWPRVFREEVVQRCEWADGQTDDGWGMITIGMQVLKPDGPDIAIFLRTDFLKIPSKKLTDRQRTDKH